MQQRRVGSTGLTVSRLGLGTMTWGRDTDEHEARDQLIAFAETGGTLLDTAAGYGNGASEELIGTLIGEPMDFSRFAGMATDRFVLRSVTDEIMVQIQRMSGQEYVDVYASTVRNASAGAAR